ncbi:MAG: diguanylate cyclase, partial [Clostridia bacterium]|nr:diguanylate cyclase [Clostridia bacterium]
SVRHGRYTWKAYVILHAGESKYLLLIANVHDAINASMADTLPNREPGDYPPELLWHNLIHSDLLRIFWKDRNRHFLGASKAFLDYYGFDSVDEIIGKNDEDLGWHVHPDQYMNDELEVIREGLTKHNIPGRCISNGENKDILASKTPLYDANGEIQGLMGYFIDRELLTVNDLRGTETDRRDMITGLLNARGVAEEASMYRDEFYLRGTDFYRVHISIDNFQSINEQYGYAFGDQVIVTLGRAFKRSSFGRTCAVARYAGHKYVILCQVRESWSLQKLQEDIHQVARSVQEVDHTPITLYLSSGGVLFSEYPDLDEQAREAENRLLQAHDENKQYHTPLSNSSEVFRLIDDLPVVFAACTIHESSHMPQFLYVNSAFAKRFGKSSEEFPGRPVLEIFPSAFSLVTRLREAALARESFEGLLRLFPDAPALSFSIRPINQGSCSMTIAEAPPSDPE